MSNTSDGSVRGSCGLGRDESLGFAAVDRSSAALACCCLLAEVEIGVDRDALVVRDALVERDALVVRCGVRWLDAALVDDDFART